MSDLALFHQQVKALYRATPHPADGRRVTQADLAAAVGLAPAELNRRLAGKGRVALSAANAEAIVGELVRWGALHSQAEVMALLGLAGFPRRPLGGNTRPGMLCGPCRRQPHTRRIICP